MGSWIRSQALAGDESATRPHETPAAGELPLQNAGPCVGRLPHPNRNQTQDK